MALRLDQFPRQFMTRVVEAIVVYDRLPRPLVGLAFDAASGAARTVGRFTGSAPWLELGNIFEAIRHFATSRFSSSSLAIYGETWAAFGGPDGAQSLSFGEPTFEAMWALEGLGYRSAKLAIESKPGRLHDPSVTAGLPAQRRGILRVGSTSVLAREVLARAEQASPPGLDDALESYFRICNDQAPSEFRGIEAESLGFVSMTMFPSALLTVAGLVAARHRALHGFFWHGVGRALFMKYPAALGGPGRSWSLLRASLPASLDSETEANALEGYGWALGLVNLRSPLVIRTRLDGFELLPREATHLMRGLDEAFLCWLRWSGWDGRRESIESFAAADHRRSAAWCDIANLALDRVSVSNRAGSPDSPTYGELLVPAVAPQPVPAKANPAGAK